MTDSESDTLDVLFTRHFTGRLTADDREQLDRWLREEPSRGAELERLRELWVRSEREPMAVDAASALARFKITARSQGEALSSTVPGRHTDAMGRASVPVQSAKIPGLRPARLIPWLAAAALLLAAGAGLWWWRAPQAPSSVASLTPASHTFTTTRGQRGRVTLPDGTRVLLAPNSRLEVPRAFDGATRDVQLVGLGFFEVAKDADHPFRVHGGGGIVQVLGTKFTAQADSGTGIHLEVVVAEGRVALRPAAIGDTTLAHAPVLTHGDAGSLAPDGAVRLTHDANLARRLGWIDGHLDFDRAPLPEVLRQLELWFDVDFVVVDSALARAHLTTTFRNDSKTDMLQVLQTALGATADVDGKTIILRLTASAR